MTKRCLILYNRPADDALPDELDVLDQVRFVEAALTELHHEVSKLGLSGDIFSEIAAIPAQGYDFVFNLVESVGGKAEILYFVPALLNMHHIPYTGCPVEATFMTASKTLARNIMKANGIPVVGGCSLKETDQLIPGRKYILKPVWEDGSLGITEESVFTFTGTLPGIVAGKREGHWFIEEFIEGREFNVSVIAGNDGPEMLPPAEMVFHDYPDELPRIVSYKAKWDEDSFQYRNSVRSFPDDLSPALTARIREVVTACWNIFGLKGYARIDIRTDTAGNVYVLEANANPCISPDSGFVAAATHAGYTPGKIAERIIGDLNP